jgi:hypothetical protein
MLAQLATALAEPSSPLPGLRVTLVYGIGLALGYAGVHLILPADMPRRPGAVPAAAARVVPDAQSPDRT